jgi:type I restriction enzyme, S subunit
MSNQVPLGDICEFKYGKGLRADRRVFGSVPVFGSNGVVGWHDRSITAGPTIVVGRKGSIGKVAWSGEPCYPIDTTYFVDKTKQPCNLKWLYYALIAIDLTTLDKSAAVPGLNREDAYEQLLPFPLREEQDRIADSLDCANRLRGFRALALELAESLRSEVFVDMFRGADTAYPLAPVRDLVDERRGSIRTGPFGSQLLHSEFTDHGIAVLGIDNAVNNRFEWAARRFITRAKYESLKRYTVLPGDVLITIMGTCGRCAVVPNNIEEAINTKHLCCISLDQTQCLPGYLHGAFLYHPSIRRQVEVATRGAIMDGLNMEIIKALRIPVPPLPLQEKYVALLAEQDALLDRQHEALRQAEHLSESVLRQDFPVRRDVAISAPQS